MSTEEMRRVLIERIKNLDSSMVEKYFLMITNQEREELDEIDLNKYVPGIFEKYDALMKSLA